MSAIEAMSQIANQVGSSGGQGFGDSLGDAANAFSQHLEGSANSDSMMQWLVDVGNSYQTEMQSISDKMGTEENPMISPADLLPLQMQMANISVYVETVSKGVGQVVKGATSLLNAN